MGRKAKFDKTETRLCPCGCKQPVKSATSEFAGLGHDAKYKSRLLQEARSGDEESTRVLVERGWSTPERIAAGPAVRSTPEEKAARTRERAEGRVARLRRELAEAEERLAALNGREG
jgi:hypothetical protein